MILFLEMLAEYERKFDTVVPNPLILKVFQNLSGIPKDNTFFIQIT